MAEIVTDVEMAPAAGPSRIATVADEEEELAAETGVAVNGTVQAEANGHDGTAAVSNGDDEPKPDGQIGAGTGADDDAEAKPVELGEEEDACETLYLQNLNEKVRLPVLQETLASLFKPYRPVLPVVAHGNVRMRGQAFVSFSDKKTAAQAKKDVNEFPLYGKAISISFAKRRADSVVKKLDGDDALEAHKADRKEHKKEMRRKNPLRQKARDRLKAGDTTLEPASKKPRLQVPDEYLPPNNVLFLQNLPEGTTQDDLRDVFGQHAGLLEIRTIPAKRDIAFVEYADEAAATVARDALHNFKIDGETKMKVTYAKK